MAKRLEIVINDKIILFNNEGFTELELLGLADILKLNVHDRIKQSLVIPVKSTETNEGEKEDD
jgi:hypothetical protein